MILKQVDNLHTLHNNPFLLGAVFPAFYQNFGDRSNGFLLSYLILPLVLPLHTRTALKNLREGVSSLLTFTSPTNPEYRQRFLGLGVRVAENRDLTNACMQYNLDLGVLSLGDDLSIVRKECFVDSSVCPSDMIRAASKLGTILEPHSVSVIFAELGIANL